MRIEKIEFNGFKADDRIATVDMSAKNVTVIFGDNGCGKTTFLKAINSFLSQDDEALLAIGIRSINCDVQDDDKEIRVSVVLSEHGYDWTSFDESPLSNSKSLSLGVERGISTQSMKVEPDVLIDFFMHPKWQSQFFARERGISYTRKMIIELSEELSYFLRRKNAVRNRNRRPEIDFNKSHLYLQSIKIENIEELLLQRYRIARFTATKKIQSALFDTLSVAIDVENSSPRQFHPERQNLGPRILESKDRIIEALDDGEDNNFKTRIVNILGKINQKGELEKILEHSLLSELFQNMIDELEVEKLILSAINLLVERFNAYLIGDKKLVVNGQEVFVRIDGERHSVNELSSGERHILTFLALVLFEGQERNFLIIDEPEISLNIKWQRELMSIFSELLPKTQIIVASHSPALAKRNPDYLSKLLVRRS
ncbi:AAA family ATPase [Pseudoalteromonas sp. UBA6610]|uniref:AAA family ATPase n=1 Tax=Pseudoalteromonas sp. UBA6610 TaxID=1947294 RepID=UPI002598B921|nr:AAA family ATPase [Pseudoalteromonas sp. UBA6610]|tara:strand:- start:1150 stop:2433 length:1284 start_codon:yes stop_codon:yes gene_type:complete